MLSYFDNLKNEKIREKGREGGKQEADPLITKLLPQKDHMGTSTFQE